MIQNVLCKNLWLDYKIGQFHLLKAFGNHFEDWLLEEKRFKDEGHTLIDSIHEFYEEFMNNHQRNLQTKLYLEFWFHWSSKDFFREFGFWFEIMNLSKCLRLIKLFTIPKLTIGNLPNIFIKARWKPRLTLGLAETCRVAVGAIDDWSPTTHHSTNGTYWWSAIWIKGWTKYRRISHT